MDLHKIDPSIMNLRIKRNRLREEIKGMQQGNPEWKNLIRQIASLSAQIQQLESKIYEIKN
jgi:seryl-tRNA synthetase